MCSGAGLGAMSKPRQQRRVIGVGFFFAEKKLTPITLRLEVATLGLGDCEVLPDTDAFGAVGGGQAFQIVQDGTRPVVLTRKRCLACRAAFEIEIGWELRVKHQAEA